MRTESERVTIDVGGQQMGGYLARAVPDEPRRFPAVVVFMEIFGINPHIRSIVDRIAAEGYVAFAPDYFHRTAPGIELGYDQEGMKTGMALIPQLKADELLADFAAALAWLRGRDDVRGDRIGAIGFCIGGHITYLAASTGETQAAASFYGAAIATYGLGAPSPTVSRTDGIRGKIMCFFGAEDGSIPQEQVETVKKALYDAGVRNEVFVYPNAGHGFFCDARAAFYQMAHDDAWKKVKKLFLDELHGAR
jgi:carboxymethylenebutenolidase